MSVDKSSLNIFTIQKNLIRFQQEWIKILKTHNINLWLIIRLSDYIGEFVSFEHIGVVYDNDDKDMTSLGKMTIDSILQYNENRCSCCGNSGSGGDEHSVNDIEEVRLSKRVTNILKYDINNRVKFRPIIAGDKNYKYVKKNKLSGNTIGILLKKKVKTCDSVFKTTGLIFIKVPNMY